MTSRWFQPMLRMGEWSRCEQWLTCLCNIRRRDTVTQRGGETMKMWGTQREQAVKRVSVERKDKIWRPSKAASYVPAC